MCTKLGMIHQASSQPFLGSQIAPFGVAAVLTDIARHDAITNTSLFQSQGGGADAVQERGYPVGELPCFRPAFPAAGIVGSRAAASRTPCGRRCAAGLRLGP